MLDLKVKTSIPIIIDGQRTNELIVVLEPIVDGQSYGFVYLFINDEGDGFVIPKTEG